MAVGETKLYWRKSFERVGVGRDDIFNEILRARKIDQVLFSDPVNRAYGVGPEDIINAMQEITFEEFGAFEGKPETYPKVYELAMTAPLMMFAPFPEYAGGKNSFLAWWRRNEKAKRILLWNAEYYLSAIDSVADVFYEGQITAVLSDDTYKRSLQLLYPYIEWLTEDELDNKRKFDYIFVNDQSENTVAEWAKAWEYLAEGGTATAWCSLAEARKVGILPKNDEAAYFLRSGNRQDDLLVAELGPGIESIRGQAVYRGDTWSLTERDSHYWEERAVDSGMERRIGAVATLVEHVQSDTADKLVISAEKLQNAPLMLEDGRPQRRPTRVCEVREGDVLIAQDKVGYRTGYVTKEMEGCRVTYDVDVLRPHEVTDGILLFLYLQSQECYDAAAYFAGDSRLKWRRIRWERVPLPATRPTIDMADDLIEAYRVYAAGRRAWLSELSHTVRNIWEETRL